jgi:hypothetical protein
MATLTLMACEESIHIAVAYLVIKRKTARDRAMKVLKTTRTTNMYYQMVMLLIWNLLSKTERENQLLSTETNIFVCSICNCSVDYRCCEIKGDTDQYTAV